MAGHLAPTAAIVALLLAIISPSAAYSNYTVGDAAGWLFNATSNSSATNYSAWASPKSFNLGDYLIFNTNVNSTISQTTNGTAYRLCNTTDDTDTFTYYDGGSGGVAAEPKPIAVPLVTEGVIYFLSEADDGAQCEQGMRFEITVGHGQGLPPALNQPPPPPYSAGIPPPPASTGDEGGQGETFHRDAGNRLSVGVLGVLGAVLFVGMM